MLKEGKYFNLRLEGKQKVVDGYFLSTYYVPVIETLNGRKYYLVQI